MDNYFLPQLVCLRIIMDCAANFPPPLPEIEMSYKHKAENKVYLIENFTHRKLGLFSFLTIFTLSKL